MSTTSWRDRELTDEELFAGTRRDPLARKTRNHATLNALTPAQLVAFAVEHGAYTDRSTTRTACVLRNWSHTRYLQLLLRAIDTPEALAADPVNVGRMRRIRDDRLAYRTERRIR